MGGGSWSSSSWDSYSKTNITNKATVDDIYSSRAMDALLNPKDVKVRESCDSADNPESTALIVALDVTGSMGFVLDAMARTGLPTLAEEVYARKPITNPHIMFMGIGDVEMRDKAPLQITQFEADIRIAEQLTKLYLERGGGGNGYESYMLAWYYAAMHTRIDCFEKRGKKGYLFTVGDEGPTPYLRADDLEKVLGYKPEKDYTAEELLNMVSRQYEVFHLIVEEGGCGTSKYTTDNWAKLLGERAIKLADHTKMGEVIVSTMQVMEGMAAKSVIDSWDGKTSLVVAKAIKGLESYKSPAGKVVSFA
jgi:hypothetical protein